MNSHSPTTPQRRQSNRGAPRAHSTPKSPTKPPKVSGNASVTTTMTAAPTDTSTSVEEKMTVIETDSENSRSRVLIIATGGTFVMGRTERGLEAKQGFLEMYLETDDDFKNPSLPLYEIQEWVPVEDSSNFSSEEWLRMADQIERNYHNYDGFIVLHGTDTMAYSASALSFILENLNKPVVFTGAQIPIGEVFNDAKNNLLAALVVAGSLEICEVCVMFDTYLYRGCRSTKIDPWHQHAFDSPNFPPLAQMGVDLEIEENLFLNAPKKRFRVHKTLFSNILVLWLVPGFSDVILEGITRSGRDVALVLAFYGVGNGPQKMEFYNLLKVAIEDYNTEIVVLSQCRRGHVDTSRYGAGNFFRDLNLINGYDMTVEAAVAKLAYLMGKGHRKRELKQLFETDLRGELTTSEVLSKKLIQLNTKRNQRM